MTQTGKTHARRVLVEGAWASRSPAKGSRHLPRRLENQPKSLQDIRWKAHVRLCKRSQRLVAKGKHAHVVTGAIARELGGFVWAMAQEVPLTLSRPIDPVRDHVLVCHRLRRCANVHEKSRSPGVVEPSAAFGEPTGPLVPRWRQAPDGGKEGGTPPTNSSRINRRLFLAPPLFMRRGQKTS
jgi:hypothetical protein